MPVRLKLAGWMILYVHLFLITLALSVATLGGVTYLLFAHSPWFAVLYPIGITASVFLAGATFWAIERGLDESEKR